MMNCDEATYLLHLDRPGERSETEERELQSHLRTCVSCSAEAGLVVRTRSSLDAATSSSVPAVHVGMETGKILRAIHSSRHPEGITDLILRLAGSRSVRVTYGLLSAAAVLALLIQVAAPMHQHQTDITRRGGAFVAYTIDTRPAAATKDLPIPSELRASLLERPRMRVRQDELERMRTLAGQAALGALRLSAEQRAVIERVIATMQSSSAISIQLGKNGG